MNLLTIIVIQLCLFFSLASNPTFSNPNLIQHETDGEVNSLTLVDGADRHEVTVESVANSRPSSRANKEREDENDERNEENVQEKYDGSRSGIRQVSDVGVDAVESAVSFNLIIFFVLMGTYEFLSRSFPSIYEGRKDHVGNERFPVQLRDTFSPFQWVKPVASVTWSQVRLCSGVDAYMYLRYLRLCLNLTLTSGFWAMVILFPVFATGGGGQDGLYHLSIANVEDGSSWRFWFPVVFMWLFTMYVFHVMNEEFKHFMEVRMEFLVRGDKDIHPQHQNSLMIENIPKELRSDKALYDYFNTLFPNKIYSACVVMNIPDLEGLASRRARVTRRLEKSFALYESTGERPHHVVGRKRMIFCGIESLPMFSYIGGTKNDDYDAENTPLRGEMVDSILYYTRDLINMNSVVQKMQKDKKEIAQTGNEIVQASEWIAETIEAATDAAAMSLQAAREDGLIIGFGESNVGFSIMSLLGSGFNFFFGGFHVFNRQLDAVVENVVGNAMSSTGFVVFKDRFSVTCAASTPLCPKPEVLSASMAPDVRDIVWDNAHISATIISGNEATANFLLVIAVLFWSVPVTFIQAMATVESIATIPGMEWVQQFSGGQFATLINGYLPVIALLALINALPLIFERIATVYEDRKTLSDVQNSILVRFFYYQLANIYITVTARSVWDSLADIIDHPSTALLILGQSVPKVVGYFTALLITKILAGLPYIMLRFDALCRLFCIRMCCREEIMTRKELEEVKRKQMVWYGWEYPSQLLVIVICFTYACICPIIFFVVALYFLFAFIVYKKQMLLTYTTVYESGGKLFPSVCHLTLIGLICGQATLGGYILVRQAYYELLCLLPLPALTYRMTRLFKKLYAEPSMGLNLEIATELDRSGATNIDEFTEDFYRQPVLSEKKAEPDLYRLDAINPTWAKKSVSERSLIDDSPKESEMNNRARSFQFEEDSLVSLDLLITENKTRFQIV